jgi:hypothetical protein
MIKKTNKPVILSDYWLLISIMVWVTGFEPATS